MSQPPQRHRTLSAVIFHTQGTEFLNRKGEQIPCQFSAPMCLNSAVERYPRTGQELPGLSPGSAQRQENKALLSPTLFLLFEVFS